MSGIAKITEEMKTNPRGFVLMIYKRFAIIISVNLAKAAVVIASIKLHGLGTHV
jgi:hypothetical protein